MCIALYLGSEDMLPIIPYNQEKPAFNTKKLDEQEKPVFQQFSLPHVIYVGSNEGCGCSFRHALYDKGQWSYVVWEEGVKAVASKADHQSLVDYLKASKLKIFEIYACWDGDYALPAEFKETISVDDLLHLDFYFKERAHYWITIGS